MQVVKGVDQGNLANHPQHRDYQAPPVAEAPVQRRQQQRMADEKFFGPRPHCKKLVGKNAAQFQFRDEKTRCRTGQATTAQ